MAQLQYLNKQILFYGKTNAIKGKINKIRNVLHSVLSAHKKELVLIEYTFISDEELLKINIESLNHNYYTDIITFDYGQKALIESDIYISIDRIKDNAKSFNKTYEEELLRVIFHGALHLVGYKDKSKKDSSIMRIKEEECLALYYKQ